MKNKVLLIFVNSMLENVIPVSISILSACLKNAGFEVKLFDTTFYKWGEVSATENRIKYLQIRDCELEYNENNVYVDLQKTLDNFNPDIIGFSTVECTFDFCMNLINSIQDYKLKTNAHISVGGVHTILAPETLENEPLIDSISIGEAEKNFIELCARIKHNKNFYDVNGFWFRKKNGEIIKNKVKNLINLDDLPFLDFDIYEPRRFMRPMSGKIYSTVIAEFSRGCPYHCSYCGDTALKEKFKEYGNWFRQKNIKKIEEELYYYIKKYNAQYLYIMSESFLNMPVKYFNEFVEMYSGIKVPFWFNTRPESITEEKIKKLKLINCNRISLGIEHGNEDFRKTVLKRNISNDKIIKACKILEYNNISYSVNLMIGFPDENRELAFDSIEICRKINPDGISVHIFNPYRGTYLREYSVNKGYINKDLIAKDFFLDTPMNMPNFPRKKIINLFKLIPAYIKFPKNRWKEIQEIEENFENNLLKFNELRKEFIDLYF